MKYMFQYHAVANVIKYIIIYLLYFLLQKQQQILRLMRKRGDYSVCIVPFQIVRWLNYRTWLGNKIKITKEVNIGFINKIKDLGREKR